MDARVVELDALSDAIGTGPEDDHLLAIRWLQLIFLVIGGIVVRSHRFELRRARIDRLENRTDPPGVPDLTHLFFTQAPQLRHLPVGESLPLGHNEEFAVQGFSG